MNFVMFCFDFNVLYILQKVDLAERFVSKSLNMVHYGSRALKDWLPLMQDTYSVRKISMQSSFFCND